MKPTEILEMVQKLGVHSLGMTGLPPRRAAMALVKISNGMPLEDAIGSHCRHFGPEEGIKHGIDRIDRHLGHPHPTSDENLQVLQDFMNP